jgi:hypothetical protein
LLLVVPRLEFDCSFRRDAGEREKRSYKRQSAARSADCEFRDYFMPRFRSLSLLGRASAVIRRRLSVSLTCLNKCSTHNGSSVLHNGVNVRVVESIPPQLNATGHYIAIHGDSVIRREGALLHLRMHVFHDARPYRTPLYRTIDHFRALLQNVNDIHGDRRELLRERRILSRPLH